MIFIYFLLPRILRSSFGLTCGSLAVTFSQSFYMLTLPLLQTPSKRGVLSSYCRTLGVN